MNIDALIKGCKEGQRKAQEGLYRNYYKTMMALCLRYTKNEADALDVLNRGFLKVFQQIQRYDPGVASPYTWIRTIVINSCLDFIKAKQRTEPWQEINEASEVHIAAEVITKMKATELLQLVRQLPPATQAVFNLYVVEGYQHKEIATLLTISEGTSKWHLSEARKGLQKMMQAGKVNHL
jgi:RNA polymerase sigma factor (sigma-70 family)